MLVEWKADPLSAAAGGVTPILMASQEGHTKTVELLHELGADVNKTDDGGMTWSLRDCVSRVP